MHLCWQGYGPAWQATGGQARSTPTRGKPMVDTTASTLTASRLRVWLMLPTCSGEVKQTKLRGDWLMPGHLQL